MKRIYKVARWLFEVGDDHRLSRYQFNNPEIEAELDIPYRDTEEQDHRFDIYKQKGVSERRPLLINIHGGGLFAGYKEVNRGFCESFVMRGFDVVNVNYRRIPEVYLIDQLDDIFAVLNFIETHHDQYKLNIDEVYLVGDSAGALLSFMTMAIHENEKLQDTFNFPTTALQFKKMGLISIMLETQRKDVIGFIKSNIIDDRTSPSQNYYLQNTIELASSLNLPPIFLFTSQEDIIRQETLTLARHLQHYHHTYTLFDMPIGKKHRLVHVFAIRHPEFEESQQLIDRMVQYFKQ